MTLETALIAAVAALTSVVVTLVGVIAYLFKDLRRVLEEQRKYYAHKNASVQPPPEDRDTPPDGRYALTRQRRRTRP